MVPASASRWCRQWTLPTPRTSPARSTRRGGCQQCRLSCSTARTATSCWRRGSGGKRGRKVSRILRLWAAADKHQKFLPQSLVQRRDVDHFLHGGRVEGHRSPLHLFAELAHHRNQQQSRQQARDQQHRKDAGGHGDKHDHRDALTNRYQPFRPCFTG